ncbi:CesT family type III secretion system chaperone, partial [Vibrio sp. 10N.261.48.A2]
LMMLSNLGELNKNNAQVLLEMNMFSQDEKKPVVGFDNKSNNLILWNHQPIVQADRYTVYQQLELLSQYYEQITSLANNIESKSIDKESHFYPTTFRV